MSTHQHFNKVTLGGLIITLGIIYGDIGTSPLYVLKEIVGETPVNAELVKGGLSAIFWTLTLQTTIKYVIFTLRADNKGEGGIFSLYTLVRRSRYAKNGAPMIAVRMPIGISTAVAVRASPSMTRR